MTYLIKGHDSVLKHFKQVSNLKQLLDDVYRDAAIEATSRLIDKTPKKTGHSARNWSMPRRLGLSSYLVQNKVTTTDGKRSLITILDKGRGPIFPKKPGGRLYIPLSNKGRSKRLGAPIPKGFVYGKDYVFAKKAGPAVGKFFIDPINKYISAKITNNSLRKIYLK